MTWWPSRINICVAVEFRKERIDMDPLNYMAIDNERRMVGVISGGSQPRRIAKETGKWLRAGLSIERCDDDFVRLYFNKIIPTKEVQNDKSR